MSGPVVTAADREAMRKIVDERRQMFGDVIDGEEWLVEAGATALAAVRVEERARCLVVFDDHSKKGPLVWQQPKMDHQRLFMLRLLATPIPLVILCMRAKYPMKEILKDGKKEWARAEVLEPKQSDDILYEMFLHGWIDREHKFHGTKYSRDDLKQILRDGEPISLETGQRLAAWAKGGATAGQALQERNAPSPVLPAGATSGAGTGGNTPVDDWVSAFHKAPLTKVAGETLWTDVQAVKGSFASAEWLRILEAKEAFKQRLGSNR